ncbi:MAG: hypothetical protein WBF09_20620 [Candidatus Acidiferrum sp.]
MPTEHSELPNTLPALVITSDYYAAPKVLVLHVLNDSGKDITGYTIIIRHKNADTSTLRNMQQPQAYGPDKGKTERERLTQYVQGQEKRVELMVPHCHLEIDTAPKP